MAAVTLSVAQLTKRFGTRLAVDRLSFSVNAGEIFGVIGPNGAGKSTLMHMIAHLIVPDAGDITIFGLAMARHRRQIAPRINLASPYAALPGRLTVRENLSVYAGLYGLRNPAARIAALLEQTGLAALRDILVSRLSSGQAARAGLCKALLNDPELLLLDEPTAYLDPDIAIRIRALLAQHRAARGMTILLTSHDLPEIETMCDRIMFLRHGRLLALGTQAEVTRAVLHHQPAGGTLQDAFLHAAGGA